MKEENIVQQCISGDRTAQNELYNMLVDDMLSIGYRYMTRTADAQDVVQLSFVRIFNNIEKYDIGKGTLKSWACKICVNECLTALRKQRRIPVAIEIKADTIQTLGREIEHELTLDEVKTCIDQMPSEKRVVLMLYYFEEYSHKEISELLNIKEASSRSRLNRARNTFLDKWRLRNIRL